jgi:hypothetical protein
MPGWNTSSSERQEGDEATLTGDLVTWTLLESYQHGHLIQATFTQKLKYSFHYVQVTDKKILERLQEMLARLKAK